MIAAIYARKSTDQTGIADDQKSVARQVEHARAYATRKGWTVADEHVYVDDGISGAEFANRPGFQRLMNALKQRAPFQALIMSEESRLGREAIETGYVLKQLVTAAVRVFFYLEDRELTLGTMADDTMMFRRNQFAAEERRKASQRSADSVRHKFALGHVVGGRVFGYDNQRVAAGHVERRINEPEAAIIRRIFDLHSGGNGYSRIVKFLNAEGAPAPKPYQGRPAGWSPSSVLDVLRRPLYRGDPHRRDAQQWVTSYASLFHKPGVPLFDMLQAGKLVSDPRMLFSWYGADFATDPAFADKSPAERANPSMASWNNPEYLAQQQRRLPSHKFRRLHLNLPGLPEGSAYSPEPVMDAIARGVVVRPPERGITYRAFVDMSGGSSDDAVLAIGHLDAEGRRVLDVLVDQGPRPPFDPNVAVTRFVRVLESYGVPRVVGDRYAGETFKAQFETQGIGYDVCEQTKSELYEAGEVLLNSHACDWVDVPTLEQQALGLVWRGGRIDHAAGEHDDHVNAAVGVLVVMAARARRYSPELMMKILSAGDDIVPDWATLTSGPDHTDEDDEDERDDQPMWPATRRADRRLSYFGD